LLAALRVWELKNGIRSDGSFALNGRSLADDDFTDGASDSQPASSLSFSES
jgi:hypothetical protein